MSEQTTQVKDMEEVKVQVNPNTVETKELFTDKVTTISAEDGYRIPIAFGICRNDMSVLNPNTVLQSNFLVTNIGENNGSAAVFQQAIKQVMIPGEPKLTNLVHTSDNEAVYNIDEEFLENALAMFKPFLEEAVDDKHLNVQCVKLLEAIRVGMTNQNQQGVVFGVGSYTYRIVFIYQDTNVETVESTYLKLYALSEGKAPLRSLNLDGAFGLLTNCAWLANGVPTELELLRMKGMELKAVGNYPKIDYVDKFPRMLQHVIPADNTRILDTSKVRMGARLAAGTTVMPGASYINFNAGTLGPVMVEGRISSSAVVGAGTDIGGGASILGVLSGTDGDPISIGKECLLGANSVTGISLGDGCIVDAGLTILPKTPIQLDSEIYEELKKINPDMIKLVDDEFNRNEDRLAEVYAFELSGLNGIHFRMHKSKGMNVNGMYGNSEFQIGMVVCALSNRKVVLNSELH